MPELAGIAATHSPSPDGEIVDVAGNSLPGAWYDPTLYDPALYDPGPNAGNIVATHDTEILDLLTLTGPLVESEVLVDLSPLPAGAALVGQLVGPWEVSYELGRPVGTATFSLAIAGPGEYGFRRRTTSGVREYIDFEATQETSPTRAVSFLVSVNVRVRRSNGAIESVPVHPLGQVTRLDEDLETGLAHFDAVDVVGVWAEKRLDYELRAGSRLGAWALMRHIAQQGAPFSIGGITLDVSQLGGELADWQVTQPVSVRQGWLAYLQSLAEVTGGHVMAFGRALRLVGDTVNSTNDPVRFFIGPGQVLHSVNGGTVAHSRQSAPSVYSRVKVTGSRQIVLGQAGSSGQVVFTGTSVARVNRTLRRVPYLQDGLGALSGPTADGSIAERVEISTTAITTRQGRTVVGQRSETTELTNPQAARYQYDVAGVAQPIGGVYVEGTDPLDRAHLFAADRAILTGRRTMTKTFDSNRRLRVISSETYGLYNPRRAIKQRSGPTVTWESQPFMTTLLTGGREGVAQSAESFRLLRREVETLTVDDENRLRRREVRVGRYALRPAAGGIEYLYANGATSADAEEAFVDEAEVITETYVPMGGVLPWYQYSREERRVDAVDGSLPRLTSDEEGPLPAVEMVEQVQPIASQFPSAAAAAFAVPASDYDNEPIQETVILSDTAGLRELEMALTGAEYPWQLLAKAQDIALQQLGDTVVVTTPFLPVFPGDRIHLRDPLLRSSAGSDTESGFDGPVRILAVRHYGEADGVPLTELRGRAL